MIYRVVATTLMYGCSALVLFQSALATAKTKFCVHFSYGAAAPPGDDFNTERLASARVASELAAKWPYWDFQAGDEAQSPILEFTMRPAQEWDLMVDFELQKATPAIHTWRVTLFDSGEMATFNFRLPRGPALVKYIGTVLKEKMLFLYAEEMFQAFKGKVPLGDNAVFLRPIPKTAETGVPAVIPVPWQSYPELHTASFTLVFRAQPPRKEMTSRRDREKNPGILPTDVVQVSAAATGRKQLHPSGVEGIRLLAIKWRFADQDSPISKHLDQVAVLSSGYYYLDRPSLYRAELTKAP